MAVTRGVPVGKPFLTELGMLPQTYDWAVRFHLRPFTDAIRRSMQPLLAIGSGGSFTTAHLACALHQHHFQLPALPCSPLELATTATDLREMAVLLLTAGGKNPDILGAFNQAILREPRRLTIVCATTGSPLAKQIARHPTVEFCEFDLPSGRDGFLATNSLLATSILLMRAYAEATEESFALPESLDALAGREFREIDFSPLLARETIVVLYSPSMKTVAIEIESKFVEAALGNVQLADYRQFAHGRHHWLAKRGDRSAVLALCTKSETEVMERTLCLLPKIIPIRGSSPPTKGRLGYLRESCRCSSWFAKPEKLHKSILATREFRCLAGNCTIFGYFRVNHRRNLIGSLVQTSQYNGNVASLRRY